MKESLVTTTLAIHNNPEPLPVSNLAVREDAPQLFDALRPAQRVALLAEIANVVKDVIEKQGWYKQIGPKKHIYIQGWTFIGGLGGCSAKTIHTEKVEGGYKAHAVVVRVDTGIEVGAAEQVCMFSESKWKGKEDYALTGMASTRACSRALSTVFRHVVELAGYSATPAEEMGGTTYDASDDLRVRPAVVVEIKALAEVLHKPLFKAVKHVSEGVTEDVERLTQTQADALLDNLRRRAELIKGKPCGLCPATPEADGLTIEHEYDEYGVPCPNDTSPKADAARFALAKLKTGEKVIAFHEAATITDDEIPF